MKVKDVKVAGKYIAKVSNVYVYVEVKKVLETAGHGKFEVQNLKTQRILTVSAMRLSEIPVKKVAV